MQKRGDLLYRKVSHPGRGGSPRRREGVNSTEKSFVQGRDTPCKREGVNSTETLHVKRKQWGLLAMNIT